MPYSTDEQIELLAQNTRIISKKLKWISANTSMLVAAQFTGAGKVFDEEAFREMDRALKREAGWFSVLSQDIRYCLSTLLLMKDAEASGIEMLFNNYRKLVKAGFSREQQTYLAAALFVGSEENLSSIIEKAEELYRLLKKKHFVLTNRGDVSLILLLSQLNEDAVSLIDREEFYFNVMQKYGFHKNNDLQTLSCMLAFLSDEPNSELADKCASVKEMTRAGKLRLQSSCYPVYGIIALLNNENQAVQDILELYQSMREQKFSLFIDKNFYFQTAAFLYTRAQLNQDSQSLTIDPGLLAMADSLIRAQEAAQAAAIATSTSAVIAASSNGGN